jgi:hypothetical protein
MNVLLQLICFTKNIVLHDIFTNKMRKTALFLLQSTETYIVNRIIKENTKT